MKLFEITKVEYIQRVRIIETEAASEEDARMAVDKEMGLMYGTVVHEELLDSQIEEVKEQTFEK